MLPELGRSGCLISFWVTSPSDCGKVLPRYSFWTNVQRACYVVGREGKSKGIEQTIFDECPTGERFAFGILGTLRFHNWFPKNTHARCVQLPKDHFKGLGTAPKLGMDPSTPTKR